MKEILTKKEAAEVLQVSERQLERFIAERKLQVSRPSHKIVRITKDQIERFLKRTTT